MWGSGYVVLPAAGLYQPIWEYDRRTLANDLSAHLVYGLTTAAAFRALAPRRRTVDMTSDPATLEALRALLGPLIGTRRPTLADIVVATLKASGVRRIYGLPGDSLNGLTDALRRDGDHHLAARPARGGGRLRGGR